MFHGRGRENSGGVYVRIDVAGIAGLFFELCQGFGQQLLVGGQGGILPEGDADVTDKLACDPVEGRGIGSGQPDGALDRISPIRT